MNKIIIALLALVVLIYGFYAFNAYIYKEKQGPTDYKNATYIIGGEPVTLKNGVGESETALGQASKTVVRYFGNEARGDLNGDGLEDIVFLITQEAESDTYFYLVGALQSAAGSWNGTHAVLIGDRVAPQTTEFRDGQIIVNYADRAPGEPMSAQPSVGKSLYLKYDPAKEEFGEVVKNFEGESAQADVQCTDAAKYFVVARSRAPEVGNDLLVKSKSGVSQSFPCEYRKAPGDIEIAKEGPYYLLTVTGDYLLIDGGTAPHPRGLVVFDLKAQKEIYTDKYNQPVLASGESFTYWQPVDTKPTAENCPEMTTWTSQGLGAGIERHVELDLTTLKVKDLGETRCSARQ